MILRKPYAFLIKNFKLIHFIMGVLACVLAYFYKDIIGFFSSYISNGYLVSLSSLYANKYIPLYLFLIIILIITLVIFIIILLYHKNKPLLFYFIYGTYYAIILFYLIYVRNILSGLQFSLIGSTPARIINDVLILMYIPQFYFILVCFIRTIGFNLKKFDFVKDMKELNLISDDNEEFEFNVSFNNENVFRKIRKYFREMKYYFLENKLIILIILLILLIVGIVLIITNREETYDTSYSLNREFTYSGVKYIVEDNVITNIDYQGNELDQYYMVVKLNINNTSSKYVNLDINNFKLIYKGNSINPVENAYKYFIDISPNKFPVSISKGRSLDTIIVYPLGNSTSGSFKLSLYNGTIKVKNKNIARSIYITLKNDKLNDVVDDNRYHLNQNLTFTNTFLLNSTFSVSNCSLNDNYRYKYSLCNNNNCEEYVDIITPTTNNKKILVCNTYITKDENASYFNAYNTINDFVTHFVYIKDINDSFMLKNAKNITPTTASDFLAFEVPSSYTDVSDLQFAIRIRNYLYKIYLTD